MEPGRIQCTSFVHVHAYVILLSVCLGGGQFGNVHMAFWTQMSGSAMQVAVLEYKDKKEKAGFFKEMTIISQLLHPNVVRLYGIVEGILMCSSMH